MTGTIDQHVPEFGPVQKSADVFLVSYNQTIPFGFPRLTDGLQRKFKFENPSLFKQDELWSIAKHRKEVVDWFQLL